MSAKSRRRGRHLPRSKRKKRQGVSSAPVAQRPEPAPRTETPPPPPKAPTPKAPVTAARATNVAAELIRIGILAGVILVILVVLVFVLS